jgi:hypothetical protein
MDPISPVDATLPTSPVVMPGAADPGQSTASMSPFSILTETPAGKQLLSGIMKDITQGAQESLGKLKEWGQDDEDDPDPDGDVTG